MRFRVRPPMVLAAVGMALSGCIDIECPAEFARPLERERFCGHGGYVAAPATYRPYVNPNAPMARPAAVVMPAPRAEEPVGQVAPTTPVTVEPVAPPAPRR